MKPRILLVDDEPAIQFGFSKYLSRVGFEIQTASTMAEAREKIQASRYDAVLLDMKLPDGNGLDWIKEIRPNFPDIAIVLITGHGDIPLAVEAMRSGADHFLTKPVNMAELEVFLRKSLELGALRRENLSSKRLRKADQPYFGESQAMKKILDLATLGAESESPILLYGETGTGKGVLAKWIHEHSPRGKAQFVEINCTSLKGELLASELFGHSKGAFTSAVNDKQGLIEVADEGTLFLDEIGDMDPTVQSQFLKVIEEKQFRRLGEVKTRRSEFRLICATHKTLLEETEKGRFRKDLFFRINVFPIHLPTLKERPEDLPGFVEYFLRQSVKNQTEIRPDVLALLSDYGWPGNVRELRNVLERAALLSRGGTIGTEHFPGLEAESAAERSDTRESSPATTDLEKVEELHVIFVLNRFGGDTKKAAEALGISRAALYRKLEKYKNQSK